MRGLLAGAPPGTGGSPDYRRGISGHSVSNHLRVGRGFARLPAGLARRGTTSCGLQQARPPTPTESSSRRRPARVVCVTDWSFSFRCSPPPHCCDAVTVRYRTILHRTEADFHRFILLPSQAHWRRLSQPQYPATFQAGANDSANWDGFLAPARTNIDARPPIIGIRIRSKGRDNHNNQAVHKGRSPGASGSCQNKFPRERGPPGRTNGRCRNTGLAEIGWCSGAAPRPHNKACQSRETSRLDRQKSSNAREQRPSPAHPHGCAPPPGKLPRAHRRPWCDLVRARRRGGCSDNPSAGVKQSNQQNKLSFSFTHTMAQNKLLFKQLACVGAFFLVGRKRSRRDGTAVSARPIETGLTNAEYLVAATPRGDCFS